MSENSTTLAIVTTGYDAHKPGKFMAQAKKQLHFKAAAAYAAKVILDPENYEFDSNGDPRWSKKASEGLRIFDDTMTEVAVFGWRGSRYWDAISGLPSMFGPVMYVLKACANARNEVKAIGAQEMTPAEIEREFGLNAGVVRKYIHDHRESLLERGVIRKADERTILCKRGWAINRWGQKK